ncbi:hypothetical protein CPC735_057260 [Coccidioides posadasii C735 delta SOWgp]|uniref:Glyoxalase-like domain-containing protein n=1 Tax=Coccidioides posadasii (strain C735) TaxID=222929 RepID=C5PIK3_COCP7|nr:hypothetical protein CPC735_057260 [Coccidioides posadasii C735 delta SOWgp]EER24356.1 hypothetical protein CPC735_057260 [Coccidioides posadasii C735 delta SOWgp]|eukprot:XP_003066501.1 hypothetical protein CPC735_057260 [Coccidioides posadasii C735 delta SOWgp]
MSYNGEILPGPAPTRLRQIVLVAHDIDRAESLLTSVLGTEVIFIDPGVAKWGLRNILVAIGGDVIEVVSPTKSGTTAGRLLSKRGDGGYMIIMQTMDADWRRAFIESKGLGKVIFSHRLPDSVCIQYHPKRIKGGMMPELDSHRATPANPEPLASQFSQWHACGSDYASYSAGMRRCSHLHLVGIHCRLEPGDLDIEAALNQWEEVFGVPRTRENLQFTNAWMSFVEGKEGASDGLVSITIAVQGKQKLDRIFSAARSFDLPHGDGWIDMLGLRWHFVLSNDAAKL